MSLYNLIGQKYLVLAGKENSDNMSFYVGIFNGKANKNIILSNAYILIGCKDPYYKVANGEINCYLSKMSAPSSVTIEIQDVTMSSNIKDATYKQLLHNQKVISSEANFIHAEKYATYYKLHLANTSYGEVNNINGMPIVITSTHGKAQSGYFIDTNLHFHPCYIITFLYTHGVGESLHKAYEDAKNKILSYDKHKYNVYDYATYVVKTYPNVDEKIPVVELIELHNIITNSCSRGINAFLSSHLINIDGTLSMRQFLTLTEQAYAPEIIKSIVNKYGITI